MTVYLHVGMPKCASSSLQAFFHHNDEQHRKLGLCYPRASREEKGYFSHRPLHDTPVEEVPHAVKEIAREAEAAKCDKILISSEEFSNSRWDREITSIVVEALNAEFGIENVRLLFLFRNHFSFVESTFAQYLKGGMFRVPSKALFQQGNATLADYIKSFHKDHGFNFFRYTAMVNKFREHAPHNEFELYSIERADLGGKDIIEVLCEKFGVPFEDYKAAVNTRYSKKALLALHYARAKYGFDAVRTRRNKISKLFPKDGEMFSPVIQISEDVFKTVESISKADRALFRDSAKTGFKRLLSRPEKYRFQQERYENIILSDQELADIDAVMQGREVMTS